MTPMTSCDAISHIGVGELPRAYMEKWCHLLSPCHPFPPSAVLIAVLHPSEHSQNRRNSALVGGSEPLRSEAESIGCDGAERGLRQSGEIGGDRLFPSVAFVA